MHVTLSLARDLPSLRDGRLYRVVRPCFVAGKERFGARVLQFAVQRNHVHLLLEAADRVALWRALKGLGVRVARRLNRHLGRKAPVLAERYHARALRTPSEVRNCLVYVLCNARKHERGWGWRGAHDAARGRVPGVALVSGRAYAVVETGELGIDDVLEGRFDPFSSAAWFDGWRGGGPDGGPPLSLECPVARPRTWLAATGWRRRGLLDPAEAPAPGAVPASGQVPAPRETPTPGARC